MHTSVFHAFQLFVGVATALLVIGVLWYYTKTGSEAQQSSETVVQEATFPLRGREYIQYDNRVVSGTTVCYLIEKYDSTDFIRVITKENLLGFHVFSAIKKVEGRNYINSTSQFVGRVYYNSIGQTVGICFTEVGATLLTYEGEEGERLQQRVQKEIQILSSYNQDQQLYQKNLKNQISRMQEALQTQQKRYQSLESLGKQTTQIIEENQHAAIYGSEAQRTLVNELTQKLESAKERRQELWDIMALRVEQERGK